MSFSRTLDLSELWAGEMAGVEVAGVRVLLVNLDGCVHAYEDRCAHQGFQLSRGRLEGHRVRCALHEWCYDARTGAGENPTGVRLRRYPVRIEAETIWVDVGVP